MPTDSRSFRQLMGCFATGVIASALFLPRDTFEQGALMNSSACALGIEFWTFKRQWQRIAGEPFSILAAKTWLRFAAAMAVSAFSGGIGAISATDSNSGWLTAIPFPAGILLGVAIALFERQARPPQNHGEGPYRRACSLAAIYTQET